MAFLEVTSRSLFLHFYRKVFFQVISETEVARSTGFFHVSFDKEVEGKFITICSINLKGSINFKGPIL